MWCHLELLLLPQSSFFIIAKSFNSTSKIACKSSPPGQPYRFCSRPGLGCCKCLPASLPLQPLLNMLHAGPSKTFETANLVMSHISLTQPTSSSHPQDKAQPLTINVRASHGSLIAVIIPSSRKPSLPALLPQGWCLLLVPQLSNHPLV